MSLDRLPPAALDALPQPVVVLGADGRVVRCNQAAARLTGVAAWRLVGRSWTRELDWLLPDVTDPLREFLGSSSGRRALHAALRSPRRPSRDVLVELSRGDGGHVCVELSERAA